MYESRLVNKVMIHKDFTIVNKPVEKMDPIDDISVRKRGPEGGTAFGTNNAA